MDLIAHYKVDFEKYREEHKEMIIARDLAWKAYESAVLNTGGRDGKFYWEQGFEMAWIAQYAGRKSD